MKILGIGSPFAHDASAALIVDGKLVAAAEEERFSRNKHAWNELAIRCTRYCLEVGGVAPGEIDVVAYPWSDVSHKKHRFAYAKRAFATMPGRAWKQFRDTEITKRAKRIRSTLSEVGIPKATPVEWIDHHLAHAASAFYVSGFPSAAILTLDGAGEFTSTLIAEGNGREITPLREILKPDSLGFFYTTMTEYLGFKRGNGEYKMMGMSAYGDPSKVDMTPVIRWTGDGFRCNDEYVWARRRLRHRPDKYYSQKMVDLWGPAREGEGLSEPYIHIAAAAQKALEDIVLQLIDTQLADVLKRHEGRLCLAGGCALNVRMNRKILESPHVNQIYVQPASGDSGTPLGAALESAVRHGDAVGPMTHPYLGPEYTDEQIESALDALRIPFEKLPDDDALIAKASDLLAAGEVVSWFQGRMEFGPRALGNRSILGHPAHPGTSDEINARIKFREKWRPFCPSLLAEATEEVFGITHPSPFMNLSYMVNEDWRSKIPEAVHVDGSARPQTVTAEQNPLFHKLISAFKERTGLPVLINTSLNRRGEPMVCSPEDAIAMLYGSGLEHLFMGRYYVTKKTGG